MVKVISIDPGGTTGFTYAQIKDDGTMEAYPFQAVDDVDDLWRRLAHFAPNIIIIEDFEYRNKARAGLDLTPVQLIGVTRLYWLTEPTGKAQIFTQKASYGKAYYSDNMLKKYGFYKRALGHGMDSLRHLLQWYTFGAGYQYLGKRTIEEAVTLLDSWYKD